jgi:hypothetical protein
MIQKYEIRRCIVFWPWDLTTCPKMHERIGFCYKKRSDSQPSTCTVKTLFSSQLLSLPKIEIT